MRVRLVSDTPVDDARLLTCTNRDTDRRATFFRNVRL